MDKITFTDATLTTQAKVTISGTDYEVTPATYSGGTDLNANTFNTMQDNIENAILTIDDIYPVGSIYLSVNATNPSSIFGGTWESWGAGKVPVGVDTNDSSFNTVEKTGGEKTHTLIKAEMPKHSHQIYGYNNSGGYGTSAPQLTGQGANWGTWSISEEGSDQPHNNLQPYITCYMWKRTA